MSRTKLILLGTGTSWRHAPLKDASYEVWGPSYMFPRVVRMDIGFEVHDEPTCKQLNHWELLKTIPIPVYMQEAWPCFPTSRVYPLDAVNEAFRIEPRLHAFCTSTPSYMLAFALLERPDVREIHLHGIDVTTNTEYAKQHPSIAFFLGVCHGRGIRIVLPQVSDLLKTRFLYGYHEQQRARELQDIDERLVFFKGTRDDADREQRQWERQKTKAEGAIADAEYMRARIEL